ncbi:cell division protein FtsQ/DivIB [Anaerosinus massiliensis]|uniref:cell division protein FtsQ/DivIB n=1 Tax=Massilibacillus massiliensis TaxID=1806837 RepID=UPI000DA63C53|nr:FtsQ-type POTRA domain-containing protein [Massilibacillus massiliensis]
MADLEDSSVVKNSTSKQLFLSLLFIFIVLITGFSFIISPTFSIGEIKVDGNKYLTTEEIYQIAGVPEKINIFRLNTKEIQERLLKDLRISEAAVSRDFPSRITIHIVERKPIAYIACDYGFLEIDKSGLILAAYKNIKNINVPMITGIVLQNLYVGDKVDHAVLYNVLEYLSYLDESSINQMSEVNATSSDQLIAYTNSSVQIRIGKNERLLEKAKLTEEFLGELKKTKLPIEYIDLNFASPFIKFKK